MFERYTERARRIIFFARYEASAVGSPFIESEHLLLGLLRDDPELTLRFELRGLGEEIRRTNKPLEGGIPTSIDLPLSHHSKRILAYAAEEAERMTHRHIGPAHLLLGILREEQSEAAKHLASRGLILADVRKQVATMEAGGVRGTLGMAGGHPGWIGGMMFNPHDRAVEPLLMGWFHRSVQEIRGLMEAARSEAVLAGSASIETRHLLSAIIREEPAALGPSADHQAVQTALKQQPPPARERVAPLELPWSEEAKRALGYAIEEAENLHQAPLRAAHLLIGLLRDEDTAAAKILLGCGLSASGVRANLSIPTPPPDSQQGRNYV